MAFSYLHTRGKENSGSLANKTKMIFIFLIVQNLLIYRETQGLELNSLIEPCDAKDPKLNECMKAAAQKFIPILANGIKDWDIPPSDPLTAPIAVFKSTNSDDTLQIEYRNIVQTGFSSTKIEKVEKIDLANGVMAFKLNYPCITFLADYSCSGKMLDFEFSGQGRANITALNFINDFVMKYHVEADHIKLNSMKFNLLFDKVYLDFPNVMINGDEELSKSAGSFLNENAATMLSAFKPQMEEFYEKSLTKSVQNLFDAVPYSVLFKGV